MKRKYIITGLAAIVVIATLTVTFIRLRPKTDNTLTSVSNNDTITEKIVKKSQISTPKEPPKPAENTAKVEEPQATEEASDATSEAVEDTEPEVVIATVVADEISRPAFNIPKSESQFVSAGLTLQQAVERGGKDYYSGYYGYISSKIVETGRGVVEILTAIDRQGRQTAELEIGLIAADGRRLKYAVVARNRISVTEVVSAPDEKLAEMMTEYSITPEMTFVKGKTYHKL
jgi:hypothetical protein